MLKLVPPGKRGPNWYVSGRHRGHRCDYSTGTTDEARAQAFLLAFTDRLNEALDNTREEDRRARPRAVGLGEFETWFLETYQLVGENVYDRRDNRRLLFHRTGNYRIAKVAFRHWLKRVREHRMKFLLAYGWLPETVDHIDRNGFNNALTNLRAATPASQAANVSRRGRSARILRERTPGND